jgi:hypothetical protein
MLVLALPMSVALLRGCGCQKRVSRSTEGSLFSKIPFRTIFERKNWTRSPEITLFSFSDAKKNLKYVMLLRSTSVCFKNQRCLLPYIDYLLD